MSIEFSHIVKLITIFIVFSQNTIVHGSKTLYVIQNYMNNV